MRGQDGERTAGALGFADDVARHRVLLVRERNQPYQRALEHLSALLDGPHKDDVLVDKIERCWRERVFTAFYERPLLLLAAVRHDAITTGSKHPLARGFADVAPDAEQVTRERLRAALAPDRIGLWLSMATRRVQTNETSRAFVWLWPALLLGADGGKRVLTLADIGASAGLNLIGDRLPAVWNTASGAALKVASRVACHAKVGFDTHPLDVRYDDDVSWMRACIWPGEAHRLSRFDAAVAELRRAYESGDPVPELVPLNAALVAPKLAHLSTASPEGALVVAYQTFVRGYLEPERQRSYGRAMESWLEGRPPGSALWMEMELDDERREDEPAAVVAHARTSRGELQTFRLARCGYHPSRVCVDDDAVGALVRAMGA